MRTREHARYQANIERKRADDRARSARKTENHRKWVPKEEDIPQVAQQMADMFISGQDDEPPTTNAPVLFRECFVETYMEGYRFGLFSIHHGMLDLLAGLPDDRHHDVIYRFAWEKITQESVYEGESDAEPDFLVDNGVEAIKAIYKQYQALN